MGDTTFGQGGGEPRRRGQQATSGAVGASSFAASRMWSATAAEGGTSYLAQRKEQIYGVFADEVEDELEEEQGARKSGKKGRSEQLLLVSGSSSTSEEEEEEGCVDGRGSGESGDEDVPEGCVTGRGSRSSSKNKSSRRYGRRIKFVGGGVWRPDTVQEQKKRKTGEQQETGSNAAGASSTSAAGGRREFATGAASGGGEGREETNASDTKTKKHPGSPAAAGVFEEEGEEDETETNEAGSMSLRERILNAQVLKEVLGDAYYDLSSEDEDVKAAAGDSKSQDEAATAAQGRESSTGHTSSSSNDSSSKMTKEGLEGTDAGASDAAAEGLGDHAATLRGSQQAGGAAAAPESSSSSDEDIEGGNATEKATVRQRSFRFSSSSSRGDTGAQMRQNTAQGGAGIVQPAKERNTWGFAKMEKTYGVGFKLLKKMGFKGGGLGRHGTGVANPLEVRIREKNKGLQDSGEKVERKKAARGKQLTALDILLGARKREKSAAGEEAETFAEAWKKPGKAGGSSSGAGGGAGGLSAAERRRRRLGGLSPTEMAELRVKELQQSYRSSSSSAVRRQGPAVRIIDMTGPEARVIENESELQQTLQQQKQRAAAAGARRGRKLGGGDKTGAAAERDMGRGEDDDRSDGALLSDEESLVAGGDADEEESAEDARVRNLPFKALRQQLETIVRDVEAQLESIVRDKKVGEQVLLESVDYVPMGGAAGTSSGLFARTLQCKTVAASASSERTRTAATAGEGTADSTAEQNTSAPCGSPAAGAAEAASATAARLYEEEVAAAVCDACVVADRASALLQRVQALYDHVTDSSNRAEAAGAAPPDTAAESAAVCKQAKELPADEAGKKAATTKPGSRKHTSLRSRRLAVAGELVEETDRWSGSEDSSKSRSPSVDSVAPKRKGTSGAASESAGDAPSKSSAAEGSDADAGALRAIGNSSSAASSGPYCSVDLDSLVVAAEEWRSTARFEFRLLQVPAVLAALAGLILERRLRGWAPLGVMPTALGAESAEDNAKLAAPSQKSSAAAHPFEGAGGVTASSVARLLAFLVSLQQHEEAETRVFLSAVTAADEKVRASGVAGSTCCWAAGLLAAATPGPAGGRGEVTGRGAAVAKCLQKWQEDEITKIEDEAFGARKRGAAASRRMRSTLGLFPLRLEGTTGTLRLLQLPMRECAEPYRLGFDVLEKVLQQAVVGRLRTAIINEWQPEKEGEEELSAYANSAAAGTLAGAGAGLPGAADSTSCYRCLSVVEKWFAALPVSCAGQLTEEAVVPKLLQGINAWDPSKARVPIHMWLQPWLPYLTREHLQLLSLPLQAKIAAALDEKWHPADRSAVGLLLPWKNVFDAYSFAALLQRSVMPKLHDHLLNMPVRPDHQRLEPLQDVLAWVPLLPVEMLVNLFLTAFFPRWLQVLRVWLGTPQVDLTEVLEWYAGWKQIFPPALLAHPRVQSGVLVEALQLMNFASAAVGMQAVGAPGPAGAAGVSPHLQQPAPLGLGATSALPHVSPVHAGPAVPGAAVDPAAAAAASASPAYVLHHDLGMGASPYPAPPPTAAPPPPPSSGLAGGHIGAGGPYDFSTGVAAAAGSHVGGGAICSPGVTGVKPVEPEQPISLLDYLEGLAKEKNILFKPKPGRVEEGKQVYAYGRMNMYVKEKLIYVKGKALHSWTAVDVDELLKLAKGEWTKLKGTTYERK